MNMRKLTKWILGVVALCFIAGCAAPNEGTEEAISPTEAVQEAVTPEATATPEPTATPAPTATPTPSAEELYWQEVLEEFSDSKYDLTAALTGDSLKDLCNGYFKLGVGLTGSSYQNLAIHSEEYMTVARKHFNSVTLTNLMKPSYILDQRACMQNIANGTNEPALEFMMIEEALQWCLDNGVQMRGHTIVWHSQTPDWFFREGYESDGAYVNRETMLARLDSYTKQLMKYCQDNYPGVVYCWDVVNEAVDPTNGDLNSAFRCRMENDNKPNMWYHIIGEDYVEQAFRIARKYAAEGVSLFYNDYNTYDAKKSEYIYQLCKSLAEQGLIDGIGMQAYWGLTNPTVAVLESRMKRFGELGLELQITELTISPEDLSEENLERQAKRYASLFYMLSTLDTQGGGPVNITGVTLFGLMDGYVFYGDSDTSTARLFDTYFQPKPAFDSVKTMLVNAYKNRITKEE